MKRFLREPLVHFLILGAAIFALYGWMNRDVVSDDEIVVSQGQQEHMLNVFARTWQRPPTQQEFEGLIRDFVREEIAYREGKAMGFDEGDTIIRRRMRQKLELLTDEIVGLDEPTDAELQQFLDENREQFRLDSEMDLRQVYFSTDRRGENASGDAASALELLKSDEETDWSALGDPFPLGNYFHQLRSSEIGRQFGQEFIGGIAGLEAGVWHGPVDSAYGTHLVFIENLVPGRDPDLAEVRDRVRSEWFVQRRSQATDDLYEAMAEKYTISIEPLSLESTP